jgi:peptidoglycan hydrolase-like protein with peptidoglycan-binding domain
MSSFDQVIKNILADIFAEEEQQKVTRPRARPEGLMSSTRPRARPEDVEPVQPSASESTSKFVAAMSDYDDTPEEGVEIPLAFFKGTARDLEGRYKTTGMQLAKLNKNRGDSNIRVAAVEEDTTVDDLIAEVEMSMKPMLRPRARPKSIEEIQKIRAEQASYTKLDSVRDIQQALNAAGIEVNGKPLVVDGIKGRNTIAAIKAFQKREGLKVDGIVGKNTKAALYTVKPRSSFVQEIRNVLAEPEIKEEELSSIYDTPAQVGPDQMQVGFSKDDADALSTDLRYQEYLRREEDKEQRNAIETSKLITESKDDSGITRPRARPESTEETVEVVDASVFGGLGYALGELGLGTSEYRFFANNIINPGGTYTEKDLNGSDKRLLKKAISSARADGRNYVDYEKDFGVDEKDVNKASPFAGIIDPTMRMARTVGVFRFSTDDEGNTIIEDTFDFNYGPKRGAYQDAVRRGDRKEALYLLSPLAGTSPVEAASMIGYVRQENLKARGEPYQTNIRINLGKF